MKKNSIILFLLFSTLGCYTQVNTVFDFTEDSDTSFWYSYLQEDSTQLGLIEARDNLEFLRISSLNYILELSDTSNKLVFYV